MRLAEGQPRPQDIATYEGDGRWVDETFNEVLDAHAAWGGDRVAVVDSRVAVTYAQYRRGALRAAQLLLELGLERDDVLAVQLPNCVEFALLVNGACRVGIPFCQFHPGFRAAEVELVLGFTEAAAIVVPDSYKGFDHPAMIAELAPRLPHLRHVLVVGDDVAPGTIDVRRRLHDPAAPEPSKEKLARRRPVGNDLMRVAFTSGTTGDPKAVVHTYNTSRGSIPETVRVHGIGPSSVLLLYQPVGLNLGLQETFRALFAGARIVYMESFQARRALELIAEHGVTHIAPAPAGLIRLLQEPGFDSFDLSSLQLVVVGGAPCPESLIREWDRRGGGRILQTYGMLEMGSGTLMSAADSLEDVVHSVGRTHPAIELRIAGADGEPLQAGAGAGAEGEVLARGPSVALGYHANPAANAATFTADGWLRSGDIGTFDARGYLHIVGRRKEMIIRGGANIYPSEIEDALMRHPAVADCGVAGIPDARLGEIAGVLVVPAPGHTLTFAEMTAHLRGLIATYKVPERLMIVDELPRTPTGKLRRPDIAQMLLQRTAEVAR